MQHSLDVDISEYQYIGLGSIYYYDFILFHKYLNIRDMISLDDKAYPHRFEFNKPYDFVRFKQALTTKFLSTHDLDKKSFIWLDYDSKLIGYNTRYRYFIDSPTIFDDIRIVTRKGKEGNLFVLTVNIAIQEYLFLRPSFRETFIEEHDEYLSSKYRQDKNITFENYSLIIQNIIVNIFRNNEKFCPVKFRKLFSFIYQDGAPMYTIGGIFSEKALPSNGLTEEDNFLETDEDKIINIDVPLLTYCEKMKLDKNILKIKENLSSLNKKEIVDLLGFEMEPSELRSYLDYYRYYPQYYEGII